MIEFNCFTQCGTSVLVYDRIELGDPEKVPVVKDGYRHFEQWAEVLKGVANGTSEMDDISRLLPSKLWFLEGAKWRRENEEVDLGIQHFSWTMETMNIWSQFFQHSLLLYTSIEIQSDWNQ